LRQSQKTTRKNEKEIDSRIAATSPMSAPKPRYGDRSQPCVHETTDAAAEADEYSSSLEAHKCVSSPVLLSGSAYSIGKKLV
jgi:hypothetical protein